MRKPQSEADDLRERWAARHASLPGRWYTVEYDENSQAWLVTDTNDRICLEHGMQVEVIQIGWR